MTLRERTKAVLDSLEGLSGKDIAAICRASKIRGEPLTLDNSPLAVWFSRQTLLQGQYTNLEIVNGFVYVWGEESGCQQEFSLRLPKGAHDFDACCSAGLFEDLDSNSYCTCHLKWPEIDSTEE